MAHMETYGLLCGLILTIFFIGKVVAPPKGQPRIVGGQTAPSARAPYAVSLRYRNKHFCGGSLIGSRTILTAAHCVASYNAKDISVRAGSNFRLRGGVVTHVSGWKLYPFYNRKTNNYDMALIYLERKLNFTSTIQPIKLYNGQLRANQRAVILGWGLTRERGRASNNLRIAAVQVSLRRRCKRAYGVQLRSAMFCAGAVLQTRDACQGDSGGPFVIGGRLAGVISVGNGCGRVGYPGIYTKVPLLRKWIQANSLN